MSILQQGIVPASAGGYEIDNSLRFNDDDSAYLSWTPTSAGNRKTWTLSGWVKRGNLGTHQRLFSCNREAGNENRVECRFGDDDKLNIEIVIGAVGYTTTTSSVYRDASHWYHIVLVVNTTEAVSSNRVKIYVNNKEASYSSQSVPNQNADTEINNNIQHGLGHSVSYGAYFDGYLAEVNFIDGQALTPDNFGETGDYGEWKPIEYTGAYGVNGFYLDFENSGSLGADVSGNGNNWTPTNLAATDQMLDSPTNNFCTLNPLEKASSVTLSEGNLRAYPTTDYDGIRATIGQTTGKWYFEAAVYVVTGNVDDVGIGITGDDTALTNMYAVSPAVWAVGGSILKNNAVVQSGLGSFAVGDIIGVALNLDSGTVQFYKNNTAYGSAETLPTNSAEWLPSVYGANTRNQYLNFGQDSSFAGNKTAQGNADGNGYGDFYYTPPSGFLALCTQNLPDPTVIPSEHFSTVLWTGNGTSQSITGVGFQPDWSILKKRNSAGQHMVFDVLRGVYEEINTNTTEGDTTRTNTLTSFDSDGFSVGDHGDVNSSSDTFVGWNWKANGAGVSNTDGSITSTVSVNTSAGFSIVSYTGTATDNQTFGHGLSQAPEMVIVKNRTEGGSVQAGWQIYHKDTANNYYLQFTTAAKAAGAEAWNSTTPTSSVVHIGNSTHTNQVDDYIAYCFHSVDGFSKVGSYTGNGSTSDGTFVYTGFRPAFVLIKCSSNADDWHGPYDSERGENPSNPLVYANLSSAENAGTNHIDQLSNGFKLRSDNINQSGRTFIYIAFAENPFKHTNAR